MKFNIGDIVECVEDRGHLKKGQTYRVDEYQASYPGDSDDLIWVTTLDGQKIVGQYYCFRFKKAGPPPKRSSGFASFVRGNGL